MKKLFNNRIINVVLLVVNLCAALITIFSFLNSIINKTAATVLLAIFIVGILYAIAYFLSLIFLSKTEKAIDLTDNLHHVIDAYKDVTIELRDKFEKGELSNDYALFRESEIRNLIVLFKELIKDAGVRKAKISIKLFHYSDSNTLYTFCRGEANAASAIRREHDEKIPIQQCTSFNGIMQREFPKYFIGNDLVKAFLNKEYSDFRGKPKYSSALVVPIRAFLEGDEPNSESYYDVIGFLCIDSKEKNQFLPEEPVTKMIIEITRAFSDCLYLLITETQLYYEALLSREGGASAS